MASCGAMQQQFCRRFSRRPLAIRAEMPAWPGGLARGPPPAAAVAATAPPQTSTTSAQPRSYLSAQDLEMVRQSLQARMAYAEAPLLHHEPPATKALNVWEEYHPSQGWKPQPHHLSAEAMWRRIREESKSDADDEPTLASFLHSSVLAHSTFEQSLAFVIGHKLASPTLYSTQIKGVAEEAFAQDPSIIVAAMADIQAVLDRDPACTRYTQALLNFKGYQAIQCHRVAHHLWTRGRRALALMLASRVSETFHVDIHPAAKIGRGVLLDHATGVVIGETASIGDNVSMLHHVTLGGSGTGRGIRHPQVGHGALLGAGVTVLGPVKLGAGAKVGAGSVVVTDLEPHSVAVGVPARVIKRTVTEPSSDMDQTGFMLDYII